MSDYDHFDEKQVLVKAAGRGITKMLGSKEYETVGSFLGGVVVKHSWRAWISEPL